MPTELVEGGDQALLAAVATACARLLRDAGPPPVTEALGVVGQAMHAARLVLVAARPGDADSAPRMESRQQWLAAGIPRVHPGAGGWPRYPDRWLAELRRGTAVAGVARAFPPAERALLDSMGVGSIVLVPVVVGDRWYGHLAGHDPSGERTWSEEEVAALHALATALGSAIDQRRTEAEASRRSRLLHLGASTAAMLLDGPEWRRALPQALEELRTAMRAWTAWAYGPDPEHPGTRALLLYEVLAPGTRPGGGRRRSLDIGPAAAARLQVAGGLHDGQPGEGPAILGPTLDVRGGASWAVAPMAFDTGGVGMVGLEAEGHRAWTPEEMAVLELAAVALRAAILGTSAGVATNATLAVPPPSTPLNAARGRTPAGPAVSPGTGDGDPIPWPAGPAPHPAG